MAQRPVERGRDDRGRVDPATARCPRPDANWDTRSERRSACQRKGLRARCRRRGEAGTALGGDRSAPRSRRGAPRRRSPLPFRGSAAAPLFRVAPRLPRAAARLTGLSSPALGSSLSSLCLRPVLPAQRPRAPGGCRCPPLRLRAPCSRFRVPLRHEKRTGHHAGDRSLESRRAGSLTANPAGPRLGLSDHWQRTISRPFERCVVLTAGGSRNHAWMSNTEPAETGKLP